MSSPTLRTDRLELLPLDVSDAAEMAGVLADPSVYRFIGGAPPSLVDLRERFGRFAAGRSADGRQLWHNWVVRLSADGTAIGTVQATVDVAQPNAEIAWVIGVPWQGRGYASEAATALVAWLAGERIRSVIAHVHPDHAASAAVARRAGLLPTDELEDGERIWRWVAPGSGSARLRQLATEALTSAETATIRSIMTAAFGPGDNAFTEDDWRHALGGLHFVLDVDGMIVTHAAVVERLLHLGDRPPVRTGYVEAVATIPGQEGNGFGSQVMEAVNAHIRATYDLGALGTGRHHFYERLGWQTWRGPAHVRTSAGLHRTPDDEGYILVLRTPASPEYDLTEPISCEWRPGDAW